MPKRKKSLKNKDKLWRIMTRMYSYLTSRKNRSILKTWSMSRKMRGGLGLKTAVLSCILKAIWEHFGICLSFFVSFIKALLHLWNWLLIIIRVRMLWSLNLVLIFCSLLIWYWTLILALREAGIFWWIGRILLLSILSFGSGSICLVLHRILGSWHGRKGLLCWIFIVKIFRRYWVMIKDRWERLNHRLLILFHKDLNLLVLRPFFA